jgi:putative DNA primase/helicase
MSAARSFGHSSEAEFIAKGLNGRKVGNGYSACCPAHDDRNASLSINQAGDRVLLKCHAGCEQEDVIRSLRALGLWLPRNTLKSFPGVGNTYYVYNSEAGRPLHRTVRTHDKRFWQEYFDGNRWHPGKGPRTVVYQLDEIVSHASNTVYYAEGEKDCDRLKSHGYVATTNPMGAGKWREDYSAMLRDREIVLFYDNDHLSKHLVGQEHAKDVSLSLLRAGCRVRIVDLPEGKDISDFLDLGHTKAELETLIATARYRNKEEVLAWRAGFNSSKDSGRQHLGEDGGSSSLPVHIPLSELGNSERLIRDLNGRARYCHAMDKWFIFNDVCYAPDEDGEITRLGALTTRAIPREAAAFNRSAARLREQAGSEATPAEERKPLLTAAAKLDQQAGKLSAWALKSESCRAITAMVTLARSHKDVVVSPVDLDADPWILNVQNGVLNMQTGKLSPHSPKWLITKRAPVIFDPAAQCPRWREYLDAVFPGSYGDIIPFLQRAIGYSLTGITTEECFFVLVGGGRNGKGTLIKIISALLGSYAAQADFSSFIQRKDDSAPREDIAAMRGAYFVAAQESRERASFAEALIKNLTGGDTVRARRLHENGFEFTPRFKIWLATNHKPEIKGTDTGIWSRVRLIPFTECFEGREDKTLKAALLAELSGILNWAVEGCLNWQKHGLGLSESVAEANATYRKECDQLQTFLDERCQRGEYFSVGAHELYLAYKKWAGECGEDFITETAFGLRMVEKGHTKERKTSGMRYAKLALTLHMQDSKETLHAK